MVRHRRTSAHLLALLVLVPAAGLSEQAAQQPSRPPAIRTGITMVPIDVRAVDRRGNPVTDLTQEEFTVLEDGAPQAIRHFSTHAFTADAAAAIAEPLLRRAAAPDMAPTNRRVFLIMLARGRHQRASKYVDALADFMDRRVLPQDQVALLAWNRATDFTTDHALIRQTVVKFRDSHAGIETYLEEWFRDLQAEHGSKEIPPHIQRKIDAVFEKAGAIRPRPVPPAQVADEKAIADDTRRIAGDLRRNKEITEKLDAGLSSLRDLAAENAAELTDLEFDEYIALMEETLQDLGNLYAGIAYLRHLEGEKHLVVITENGLSLPRQDSTVTLSRAASDARIAVDVIQTGGTVGPARPKLLPIGRGGGIKLSPWPTGNQMFAEAASIQDLKLMADLTGGQLHAFKSGDDALRRLDETTRFQYLLGYYPSNPNRDGKYRKVTIQVNRPGVRIMYRQGYFASERLVPLDRRQFVTFSRIQGAAASDRTVDHIKVALGTLAVTGTGKARGLSIDVTVDISRLEFTREGERHIAVLDVALYCGDARQRVVGNAWQRVDLKLTDALRERMLADGTSFRIRAPLSGTARFLKVIVYDYGSDLVGTATAQVGR